MRAMGRANLDVQARLRIAAHLRKLRHDRLFPSDAAMARHLGKMHRATLKNLLKGDRAVGLDSLLRIHNFLKISIDTLVDTDPPREWFDPAYKGPRI